MTGDSARAIAVPREEAARANRALTKARLLEPALKPRVDGARVLFPVRDVARALAAVPGAVGAVLADPVTRVTKGEREPRVRVVTRLAEDGWDADALAAVPDAWQLLGDVVVLPVPDAWRGTPRERVLAEAFAGALAAKAVVARDVIEGEFREPAARVLFGEDTVTVHVENGLRYGLDAARLMFSQGNVHERTRMGRVDARGETVVDCFAGVGYFTLPVAKHGGASRVVALEKNPVSHRHLSRNVVLNGLESVVEPWLGDNRDYPHRGFADRVIMGYVGVTWRFLPLGFDLLKPDGGVIHYHDTGQAHDWRDVFGARVREAAARAEREVTILDARVVKTYGPGRVHGVMDVRVTPPGGNDP